MSKRIVPESMITYLSSVWPDYRELTEQEQHSVAYIVLNLQRKSRIHSEYPDHYSISHRELDGIFGRGKYNNINERLNLTISTNWSVDRGFTKGYQLEQSVQELFEGYLESQIGKPTSLITEQGKRVRTRPRSIASKDSKGRTTNRFRDIDRASTVPINYQDLIAFKAYLESVMTESSGADLKVLERRKLALSKILVMANTDVAGEGNLIERYVESDAGRLYSQDVSLQTAHRWIKQVALAGFWEYDFENCHYSIVEQLAARYGVQCPAIQHYLANKKSVRNQLANDLGLTVGEVKKCLIALIYGAKCSIDKAHAIPSEIGVEKAKALYLHPSFAALATDVKKGARAIIKHWQPQSARSYTNAANKKISKSESNAKILAHLLQGIESEMLRIAISIYPDEICLLQHDGFVATERVDCSAIISAVRDNLGFDMEMSEEQIVPEIEV